MQRIEANERWLADTNRLAGQRVVYLRAQQWGIAGHVRANGDGPVADLIPRQQIAGETEQQRRQEERHADDPVELTRWLVGAVIEDAHHVQRHRHHHQVSRPAVHVAHELAEDDGAVDLLNIRVGDTLLRHEVEHQEDARDGQHQEQEERETTETPGVGDFHRLAAHLDRVEVEEDVPHHHQRLIEWGVWVAVPEYGPPDLAFRDGVPCPIQQAPIHCAHTASSRTRYTARLQMK